MHSAAQPQESPRFNEPSMRYVDKQLEEQIIAMILETVISFPTFPGVQIVLEMCLERPSSEIICFAIVSTR